VSVRTLLRGLLLATAFALGTITFGWWAVPAVAALWGLIAGSGRANAGTSAVGAAVAWGVLLVAPAVRGAPTVAFLVHLARAMSVPVWALLSAQLALPLVLSWSATTLAASVREGRYGSR
jgi:hypothetical protein